MSDRFIPQTINDLKEIVKYKIYISSDTNQWYRESKYDNVPNDIFMAQYIVRVDSLTENDLLTYLPITDDLDKQILRDNDIMRQRFGLGTYTSVTLKTIATRYSLCNETIRRIVHLRARRIGRICKDQVLNNIRNQYCKDVVMCIISHIDDNKIRNQYCRGICTGIINTNKIN